ncbi:MAG TPA: SAM-dependent methyltransferase, partial [Nitrososphaeraceae archaeon]|nr:SAM-dependent methyltransferase [Nitrososphaeraceae archaeon]
MPKKLFVIGVGPGSPKYLTDIAKDTIRQSRYIIGYKYSLTSIESIIDRNRQEVYVVSMKNQDNVYQQIHNRLKEGDYCTIPFTGDVNFSESEVVDRLFEIFGDD